MIGVTLLTLAVAAYGIAWVISTISDILRDIRGSQWDHGVYGQVASGRSVRKRLGSSEFSALQEAYARVAEKVGGQLHNRALFESPRVTYVHRVSRVLLSLYENSGGSSRLHTQVTFTMPSGWGRRLDLLPENLAGARLRQGAAQDVATGGPEFDARYVARTEDAAFARRFLDPEGREAVNRLASLGGREPVMLSLNPSRLLIRKTGILFDAGDLQGFLETGCRLYDRVIREWERESGIEFLEDAPPENAVPVCQVCGAGLKEEGTVYCRRCRTPHHDECWLYNSGCSTFGCGESESVKRY